MDSSRPAEPAELLAHVAWVQRLAHVLVRDADQAEDLAQDALRVTLEPREARIHAPRMKAWLRGVVKRLIVDRRRAEASRVARERAVAPRESEPAPHEVVARLDQQQRVARAVRELAEPYRSTILHRYLDELPTRDVAKRMEVTEEVVRKRLARGLAQLRERLDAEFGSDTRSWAGALLSLSGAAVMGLKAKVAVVAVVLVAAALTWKALLPAGAPRHVDAASSSAPARAAVAPASSPGATGATRESISDPVGASVVAHATSSDSTILHVSVVDANHQPCTVGRLTGFWSAEFDSGHPQGREVRVLEADIAGVTTDVVLPTIAASALLSASVEGQPPSRIESIEKLREEKDPKDRHGRVERDVTLEVGGGVGRPRLSGRVLVDGRAHVPRGLVITCHGSGMARVNALDARYEIGPIDAQVERLCVTSEETVPEYLPTGIARSNPPRDEQTLDLDLSSGVTLRLNVVDRKSGAALPGVDLYLHVDGRLDPESRSWTNWAFGSERHVVTGADGVAVVSGLPRGAGFSIRRDATERTRCVEGVRQERMTMPLPREALLAESIDAASPAILERTLRLDAEDRTLHVFGDLAAPFMAQGEFGEAVAEVRFATRGGDLQFARMHTTIPLDLPEAAWKYTVPVVPHDANGRWSFEAEPGVDYQVWVEREHRRVSEVVAVRAEDRDVGPVALPLRAGADVLFRLVHCPDGGSFTLLAWDPDPHLQMGTIYRSQGETFERRLRLERPTTIVVTGFGDAATRSSFGQHRVEVDPATTPVVEIDLDSEEESRLVHFELGAGELPSTAALALSRVDADGHWIGWLDAKVTLENGDSRDPVWIEPGRYFYELWPCPPDAPRVIGVVDVKHASAERRLSIRCELEPHPRSDLGAGFEITEVSGVRPWAGETTRQRIRFADEPSLAGVETILIPEDAKFTVVEK